MLASKDHKTYMVIDYLFVFLIKCFIERTAGCISVYYFSLNIFLTLLCIFLRRNFKVLSYKVFFGRDMLNKYIMFSNSKIIVWIIVISILTKIIVIVIFFHNLAALVLLLCHATFWYWSVECTQKTRCVQNLWSILFFVRPWPII